MRGMGTVVTFIIPAYNSAATLRRCLDSFVAPALFPFMEVLVVNDGSGDNTAAIAREYEAAHPIFRLINKPNGGHGSVINAAVPLAQGTYIKVVDSDDRVQTRNLAAYITALQKARAQVVLTHFRTINRRTRHIRAYRMHHLHYGRTYKFAGLWRHPARVKNVCNFHGITYRTDYYRACNIRLSEGISYEDQEYATLPFAHGPTVMPLDLFLYEYTLGDPNQSVSDTRMVQNIAQLETVLWKILGHTPRSPAAKAYFLYKTKEILLSYYMAALVKNPDKPGGRQLAERMQQRVRKQDPALTKSIQRNYMLCLLLSYSGITGSTLAAWQKSRVYRLFAGFVH